MHLSASGTGAAVGIAHLDLAGRWIRANRIHQLAQPEDLEQNTPLYQGLLSGGLETCTLDMRFIRGDGSIVPIRMTASHSRAVCRGPIRPFCPRVPVLP